MTVATNKRIMYIDILKVIAIFAIIFNHVCLISGNVEILHIPIMHFKHFGSVGVAIFLMITGALLLNREYDSMNLFLTKKGKRLILPFIFWICIVFITKFLITNPVLNFELIKEYFFLLFIGGGFNWYFWMIIGIYCAIPVINEFIRNKQLQGADYFVKFFFLAVIFYNICIIFDVYTYINLALFIGPLAFVVLGYYLHNKEFDISNSNLAILGILGFILMFIIRSIAFPSIDYYLMFFNIGSIRMASFLDISIFGVIETICLFLFIKAIVNIHPFERFFNLNAIKKFNISVSQSSYGMYLAHMFLFVYLSTTIVAFAFSGTKTFLLVVGISLAIFFITWILVLVISKIPYLKDFSGFS